MEGENELPEGAHPSFARVIQQKQRIKENLSRIKHKIGVYSAKGGVGKTTIAINLAYTLASRGLKVGLLDADIDCPNVTMFLGMEEKMDPHAPLRPPVKDGVKVASTAMLVDEVKKPIIWRGPLISKMVSDFLEHTDWGELDYLIIDMPPGCLPAGTFVLTANNVPTPIEKIKPGEFVYSYDGGKLIKSKVVDNVEQGRQAIFKVKTPNRTIYASAKHLFLKYSWPGVYSWMCLDQLKRGDRVLVLGCVSEGSALRLPLIKDSKYNFRTHVTLPEYTDTRFMEILGHFLGDGFVKNKKGILTAGIRICEPPHSKFRDKYAGLYREVFGCHIFDDRSMIGIESMPMATLFEYLGMRHPALQKQVPPWVFSLPLDQRRAFINGYAEADGTIRHRERTAEFLSNSGQVSIKKLVYDTVGIASTNELLVRQLHELCQISGIRSTNVRKRIRKGNLIEGNRLIRPSINFEFDYSQKLDTARFKLAQIKNIEPAGYARTYDLQLDGSSHNFIANNMVVHNTSEVPLTTMQLLNLDGFIIITTPQKIAGVNSVRSGLMAKRLGAYIIGIIENMSDGKPSASTMESAGSLGTELLGCVKSDERFNESSDYGEVPVLKYKDLKDGFDEIVNRILT